MNVAGDRRGIFVDDQRQRLQRALVVVGEIDAHADRHEGGVLRAARRIENHKARAVENGTVLEDIALDAVPGFFRRLVRRRQPRSAADAARAPAKHSAAIKTGTITLEKIDMVEFLFHHEDSEAKSI